MKSKAHHWQPEAEYGLTAIAPDLCNSCATAAPRAAAGSSGAISSEFNHD